MKLHQILERIPLGDRSERADAYRKLRLIQSRCQHIWPPRQPHSGRIGEGKIHCELCLCEGTVSRDGKTFFIPSFEDEWVADDRVMFAITRNGLKFIPDA